MAFTDPMRGWPEPALTDPTGLSRMSPFLACNAPIPPIWRTWAEPIQKIRLGRVLAVPPCRAPGNAPLRLCAPVLNRRPPLQVRNTTTVRIPAPRALFLAAAKRIFQTFPAIYKDDPLFTARTGQIYPRGNR